MDSDTARGFARLVAERLGVALANMAEPGPARLSALSVAVHPRAWDDQDSLATYLAAEISRALRSASTRAGGEPVGGEPVGGQPAGRQPVGGPHLPDGGPGMAGAGRR